MNQAEWVLGALGVAFLLLAGYGLFGGYPRRRLKTALLSAKEQAIVAACAETLFPEHGVMPLGGTQAGVVEYLDRHIAQLPNDKRRLIRLLLAFVEHSPWFFGPARRFSALAPKRRQAFLFAMSQSRFYFRRLCFLSLRTLLCMAYLAHPEIAARVGSTANLTPFRKAS